jgi:hypothetical protein
MIFQPVGKEQDVLDTTICDKVCQWLATSLWFSLSYPVLPTNNIDRHDITEILFKVTTNTMNLNQNQTWSSCCTPYVVLVDITFSIILVLCDTDYYSRIFSIVPDVVISEVSGLLMNAASVCITDQWYRLVLHVWQWIQSLTENTCQCADD